ncbi:CRISPR-associated endonuclease/helicase Cas3 [compost metagenome]
MIAGRHAPKGSLAILESDTGTGKTEAGFYHFAHLLGLGLVDACFLGLPTRTSGAQIHKRIVKAVDAVFGPGRVPVTMAIPGYMTSADAPEALIKSDFGFDRDSAVDRNWHAETSKRYLASRVAVGTVDQVLLAALNSKHSTMRWSSFARSLLVIDEVHASDAYMGRILADVVEQHVARGGHVLLMSATLGSGAAHAYLRRAGAKSSPPPVYADAVNLPYPCIRHVIRGQEAMTALPSSGYRKTVSIETSSKIDNAAAVARMAAGHVRAGAKVLVIRNTVKECVAVQRQLEGMLPQENILRTSSGACVPHHGRFAAEDRLEIDRAIEAAFGKGSARIPIVAVGTQTIEQSLDIDADIIITDICPIDVLLQRLGRLHRHKGILRPPRYEVPRAIVLKPEHDIEDFAAKAGHGIGKERAYEHVAHAILTLEEIERRGHVTIPDDNRDLVEACTHPERVESLVAARPALKKADESAVGADLARMTTAQMNMRPRNWRYGDKVLAAPAGVSSRLGDPGIRVNFVGEVVSPMGNAISGISIPSFLCRSSEGLIDIPKGLVHTSKEEIGFHVGSERYSYGRHGLEKTDARCQPAGHKADPG